MSGLIRFDMDPPDVDPNGIAEDQTTGGAASLNLDGVQSDLGTAGQWDIGDSYSSGIAGARIGLESVGNLAGVTFTVTGLDENLNATTEAIVGPNNSTVESTTYWSQITDIASDGAVGTNIEVGPVDEVITKAVVLNHFSADPAMSAITGLVGTCQFDVQQSFDNLIADGTSGSVWFDVVSNQSTDQANALADRATGCRLVFDSYSSGAELQFTVAYNPFR